MMRPTDELKAEHRAIERMLDVLERACDRLEAGATVEPDHLDQMLDFFSGFADQCHHAKEEDLLFPELAVAGLPADDGPAAPFRAEHAEGRDYVQRMRAANARYRSGQRAAALAVAENARDYIALLRGHIEREDSMLFPIADARLSEAQQQYLEREFEAAEREKIGVDRHEEFHRLLDDLEQIYRHAT